MKTSETETVVKRILPYFARRGYDVEKEMTFEYPAAETTSAKLGFVDIVVSVGKRAAFVIEAKRIARSLSAKDRKQAITYGQSVGVPFVILTNGVQFETLNVATQARILWNGRRTDKVPLRSELTKALTRLRADPLSSEVNLADADSLPFRPGLPLRQLNALFSRGHGTIRKIEKNEEHAFSDFAKLLFLKLLEERFDQTRMPLPYSYRFHELAARKPIEADQVRDAIHSMIASVRKSTPYGDVLNEPLFLRNARTYLTLVKELAAVSFQDSRTDVKGAAFEYFVRATLKGKRLGQYFTPRPVVEYMHMLVGREKILNTLASGESMRVIDPACGTGGFLVYLLLTSLEQLAVRLKKSKISAAAADKLAKRIREETFFGADAHSGVAASAKMNMIVAGDGHSNIVNEDSLSASSTIWHFERPDVDLIISNPPFGTSESDSLQDDDLGQFDVGGSKGQILFLQKMIKATKGNGEICTVIDEGLLNNEEGARLRRHILETCRIKSITRLPDITFKPNKINVKSSVLHLEKREVPRPDFDDEGNVLFVDLMSLGYDGSGEQIRGHDFTRTLHEIEEIAHSDDRSSSRLQRFGAFWRSFPVSATEIAADPNARLDLKYWHPEVLARIGTLRASGALRVGDINLVDTRRGRSPVSTSYVDEIDGYALVVKAGSNISRRGTILRQGDYIEKSVYDEMENVHLVDGDILLSSTGDGTLGKCAVYRGPEPAIFDSHVTRIRLDPNQFHPEFIADFLRIGLGAQQIARLFTGSTGLIELQPSQVNDLLIPAVNLSEQIAASESLRSAEAAHEQALSGAGETLQSAISAFRLVTTQ